jgi:hypothetical protein
LATSKLAIFVFPKKTKQEVTKSRFFTAFAEETMEGEYKREESVALLVIVVLAALSLASLLIAFSYYCYISNKVSKHLKSLNGELKGSMFFWVCV